MTKIWKIVVLVLVVLLAVGAFYGFKQLKKKDGGLSAEEQKKRFDRELKNWTEKIFKARHEEIPGWEDWYLGDDEAALALYTRAKARNEAYYQILTNQPGIIPDGYTIFKDEQAKTWSLVKA